MFIERNITGLCLSGGAALGFAHIGVLRALEECGIQIEVVSGSSMGALIGALYAQGYNSTQIYDIFEGSKVFKVGKIFKRSSNLKHGLMSASIIEELLYKYIPHNTFEGLNRKFYLCVTDVAIPDWKIIESGNLIKYLICSMSIPMLFEPSVVDGRFYMDGGVMNNLPVEPLLDQCVKVIGVDVQDTAGSLAMNNLADMAKLQYYAMMKQIQKPRVALCDTYINFKELQNYDLYEFSKYKEIVEIGYRGAIESLRGKR